MFLGAPSQNPALVRTYNGANATKFTRFASITIHLKDSTVNKNYFHHCEAYSWKAKMRLSNRNKLLHFNNGRWIPISLFNPTDSAGSDEYFYMYDETGQRVSISSYMCFEIKAMNLIESRTTPNDLTLVAALKDSFVHDNITEVGKRCFKLIYNLVRSRYNTWLNPPPSLRFIAPLVNLCQCSGSGKSKFALDCTKKGPGFYVVLRFEDENDGYPKKNNVSDELIEIFANSNHTESFEVLTGMPILTTISTRCLHHLAVVITTYFRDLFTTVMEKATVSGSSMELEAIVKNAYSDIRADIDANVNLIENLSMVMQYCFANGIVFSSTTTLNDVHTSDVTNYIKLLLDDPLNLVKPLLPAEIRMPSKAEILELVNSIVMRSLQAYPFIFALDEANLLSHFSANDVSGFRIFRRALSYLNRGTRLVILTLGTNSNITDLNPPLFGSHRDTQFSDCLQPIVLSGNFDIFEDQFGMEPFQPTYESLTNPITLKELASYGHPIWASTMFDALRSLATKKLKNGNKALRSEMIPSLWMIRTGILAQPDDVLATELVSSRMANLFNIDPDFSLFTVGYPSDPCLALGARYLTDTAKFGEGHPSDIQNHFRDNEKLFSGLLDHVRSVVIDRGQHAEVLGSMIVLRAIDLGANKANTAESYESLLRQISQESCEEMHPLWEKKQFLLESPEWTGTRICNQFDGYHVTTVKEFLLKLFDSDIRDQIDKFPLDLLDGIINASHFVKLERFTSIDMKRKFMHPTPQANEYCEASGRNVIDRHLLCYALRRQAALVMPHDYFAFDLCIPFCMKKRDSHGRPIYSYIAVQVKAVKDTPFAKIENMNMHLHYVRCPLQGEKDHDIVNCVQCADFENLNDIYSNQLAIAFAIDGKTKTNQVKPNIRNYTGQDLGVDELLATIYPDGKVFTPSNGPSETVINSQLKIGNRIPPPKYNFPKTSSSHSVRVTGNLDVEVLAWNFNENVVSKIEVDVDQLICEDEKESAIIEDEMVVSEAKRVRLAAPISPAPILGPSFYRLFAIKYSGLDVISRLFRCGNSALESAQKILQRGPGIIGDVASVDFENYMRSVLVEGKVSLPFYNRVLQGWRGYGDGLMDGSFEDLLRQNLFSEDNQQ